MIKESVWTIGDVNPKCPFKSAVCRVARSKSEKAPFARYTRFLAGAATIIALR